MPTTPNMGLLLPTPTVTPGPTYATENNTAFTNVDSHNHTSGQGVPVPASGLNINGTLTFQGNDATNLRSSQYSNNLSPLGLPADLRCIYSVAGDLWFNNGIGQQIQLTIGGALNAASIGGIGGDYSTSTASVFYTSLNTTFTFWQSSGVNATIDVGDVIIRAEVAAAFGVHLTANPAMSADYNLVLPTALPVSQKIMTLDASGNIAAAYTVDGSSIKISTNVIGVNPDPTLQNTGTALGVRNGDREHNWELNGPYSSLTFPLLNIDAIFFAPYNITITSVWIYNDVAGTGGTTEFDLKVASPGGAFATILTTTGKITSAAAATIWTDSGAVVAPQAGVTKPVLLTTAITAGQAIKWDLIQSMTGVPTDARIRIYYKQS